MKDIEKNNEAFKALSLVSRRISELEVESERMKGENAKLRELVLDFYPFALGRAAKPWLAVRLDSMRELGIEAKA